MKIKTALFAAFILFMISCKKSDTSNVPQQPQQDKYLTTSAGSTWNYHETDLSDATTPVNTDYTLTSTSRDSSINSKNYHIFSNSDGSNQYLNITGNDYYQFDSLPAELGTSAFDRLYLKDNESAGTSWTQNLNVTLPGVPLPLPVAITYNIAEKGLARTVNGTNYIDVIHVTTSISSTFIPASSLTTNINSYYAKKYGLIETSNVIHLDFAGIVVDINIETKLTSATLL